MAATLGADGPNSMSAIPRSSATITASSYGTTVAIGSP
jgi:hypothetical protein